MVEGIAAPAWIVHQWAPSYVKEHAKRADGNAAKGVGLGRLQDPGRQVNC